MACQTLELTLVSARDLRGVNLVSKMEVYAVAYLAGDPRSRQRVPTDRAGGRDPTWNATVPITVPASGAGSGAVRVLLRTERALGRDRDVGEVLLPLSDVLAGAGDGPTDATAACHPVRRVASSKPQVRGSPAGAVRRPEPGDGILGCRGGGILIGCAAVTVLAAAYIIPGGASGCTAHKHAQQPVKRVC
ncbi:hypothetical protein BS78_09G121500 [Paspalum vaginatum]|nr:hypothetical protein BS78_09G121500 [Paspalum vaginatum]